MLERLNHRYLIEYCIDKFYNYSKYLAKYNVYLEMVGMAVTTAKIIMRVSKPKWTPKNF